ncbi:hypothetical protein D3C81_1360750 [compost metagenome]
MIDQAQPHQEAVEQAVVAENAHPGIHTNQDRGPGRHHDQQQQHRLSLFARVGNGISHRIANQQAQQRAEEGHLQRTQVRGDVQLILSQQAVVGHVQDQLNLVFDVAVDFGVWRDRHVCFGKADLQNDEERQHEKQEQPNERHADDDMTPLGLYSIEGSLELAHVHDRSTTPLSSSHQT